MTKERTSVEQMEQLDVGNETLFPCISVNPHVDECGEAKACPDFVLWR